MRFKKLTIHNIASIADATIDFDEKPLEGEPLFLICGETGSGKTTILDAICLALYKKTPRIEQSKSEKFGEKYFDDNLQVLDKGENMGVQVSDPRQYLRRGTYEGFVNLTFDGNAGENCCAHIAFGIVEKSNNLKPVEWTLEVNGVPIKGTTDINAKIVEVVGFDFEQFCRTTMLSQGEFTRFLKSGEKDKSDILEKLTGTEIYSRIGKRIFEITQAKSVEKENANIAMSSIKSPSDEELKQLEETEKQREKEREEVVKQQEMAAVKKAWLEKEKGLVADEEKARVEVTQWADKSEDAQVVEKRNTVTQWHRTEKERQAITTLKKLELQKTDNQSESQRLEQSYIRLVSGELFRNNEIKAKQDEVKKLDEQLESERQYATMYAECQRIVAKLQQHLEDATKAEQHLSKAKEENEKLPDLDHDLKQREEVWNNAKEAFKVKEDLVKAKQEELKQLNPSQLSQEFERINELVQQYKEAENKVTNQQQAAKDWQDASNRVEELQKMNQDKNAELEALGPQIAKAQEAFDTAKALYEKTKLGVGDYAKALRHELHEGDTCPVCGNKVANIEHDDAFEQALKPVYELFKAKEQVLNGLDDTKKTLEADIKSLNSSVETAKTFEKQKSEVLKSANEAVVSACAKLQIDATVENLSALIAEKKEAKSSEMNALKEKLAMAQAKQQEVDNLIKEKDAAALLEKEAKKAVDDAEKAFSELKASIKNFEALAAQKQKDSEQALTEVADKIAYPDWRSNVSQTINRLSDDARRFELRQKQKEYLNSQIEKLKVARDITRDTCSQVKTLFPTWSVSQEAQQVPDLDEAWNRLLRETTKLHENMVNTQKQTEENQDVIKSFLLENNAIDYARLELLSSMPHSQIAVKEKELLDIDNGLSNAKGALKHVQDSREDHALSKPEIGEEDTIENLGARIDGLKNSISNLDQEIGDIKAQINAGNDNRTEYSKKEAAFKQAEKEWQKWDSLRKLFGDSEGKTFRVIAQSFVLRELLSHANSFLRSFSDRYELVCQNNLTILVRDLYYGGVTRPVDLVSGGESFIVSLALALGLSSLNRNSLSADILFIDEGFGTLDPTVLEVVMNALGRMQVLGDRRVGIISHVEALERIPVKIMVKKVDNTTSEIKLDPPQVHV